MSSWYIPVLYQFKGWVTPPQSSTNITLACKWLYELNTHLLSHKDVYRFKKSELIHACHFFGGDSMWMSDTSAISVNCRKWYPDVESNHPAEKHLRAHTHPLCFMWGGLSIRTANLIFKSESWLFFGTTIRWNSADLELFEVGYSITCRRHKRKHFSTQHRAPKD